MQNDCLKNRVSLIAKILDSCFFVFTSYSLHLEKSNSDSTPYRRKENVSEQELQYRWRDQIEDRQYDPYSFQSNP